MIVFHEGLPGSGKSYEACAMHILPALEQGRRVVTNIEGINHAKFSELSHIPPLELKEQLICIYDPDVDRQKELILEHSGKDTLVVIDEIQNLFPSERAKLSDAWMKYVTEHRHEGLDIILMGQDRRDCHAVWRRRIQRIITFNKLSAVGQDARYRWECLEATRPEKFKKVTSGIRKYNSLYFGLYSSHTQGTDNKEVYSDKRANVLNNKIFILGIPGITFALYFAISHLIGFFSGPAEAEAQEQAQTEQQGTYDAEAMALEAQRLYELQQLEKGPAEPAEPEEPPPIDIFDEYASQHRIRLAALLVPTDPEKADKLKAQIDVLDKGYHRQEVFTVAGLRDMGWQVSYRDSGLYITKQGVTHIARAWPIDKPGRVDRDTAAQL